MKQGPNHLQLANLRDDYPHLVAHTKDHGTPVTVRGRLTYEIRDVLLEVEDPRDTLPLGCGRRNLNLAIGAAEALQLVAGVTDPELMKRVQPVFGNFMDGSVLHGAYGPRLRWQLPETEQLLRADPSTRQALATIWDPAMDHSLPTAPRDLPCTVALQFTYRGSKLSLHTHMRSNDVWLGVSYDLFQFTQLQLTMANVLGVEPGSYFHHATSFHLYADDVGNLDYLKATDVRSRPKDLPLGFEGPTWNEAAERARFLLNVVSGREEPPTNLGSFTPSERWYLNQLTPTEPSD